MKHWDLFTLPVSDEVTRPVPLCFLHNQWRKLNSLILAFELLFREAHLFPLLMWWMRSRGETRTFRLNLTRVLAPVAFSCSYPLHICLKRLEHSSNYEEDPVKRIRGFNEESASGFVWSCSALTAAQHSGILLTACIGGHCVKEWSHLCTCNHKLHWVAMHDMIFKKTIKSYAWKTGSFLFPGGPSHLDLFPGRKQPVKTSAPVSNCNSERAALAPYAGGLVKIRRASCACA